MSQPRIVFLFDVDNTLLDNDHVTADLRRFLTEQVGPDEQMRYFAIFEQLRSELGYADYLGSLQEYRRQRPQDTKIVNVSLFLLNYPFADRLYPRALEVIEQTKRMGTAAILSDGDVVFQPHKIENSGLWAAFNGNVLLYIHKEQELDAVQDQFPADHYVMLDDKLRILDAMKKIWGSRLTTVFVRQGHYAHDPKHLTGYAPADVTLEGIGDMWDYDIEELLAATRAS
ncbi:MAG TPA: HAD family hydrolase [Anaerolineae bacterium]|nr:HAD family hydrolase [Anaerolineae bacterium]